MLGFAEEKDGVGCARDAVKGFEREGSAAFYYEDQWYGNQFREESPLQ
jgi:hypothetical protein